MKTYGRPGSAPSPVIERCPAWHRRAVAGLKETQALGTASSRHLTLPTTLAGDLLRKKDLHERLIRHVAFVGQGLELLEQWNRKTNGDGRRGRSEVWQGRPDRLAPVEVVSGVVLRPETALLVLVREARQRLPSRSLSLAHRSSALVGSCLGLKSPAPTSPESGKRLLAGARRWFVPRRRSVARAASVRCLAPPGAGG